MSRRFVLLVLLCSPAFAFESLMLQRTLSAPFSVKAAALYGIVVDGAGRVWVTDPENDALYQYSPQGEFVQTIGKHGAGPGEFSAPNGVAASDDGLLYVADSGNTRVQIFNQEGKFQDSFGQRGSEPGQFRAPWLLAVSRDGVVLVVDKDSSHIQ